MPHPLPPSPPLIADDTPHGPCVAGGCGRGGEFMVPVIIHPSLVPPRTPPRHRGS